MKRNQKTIKNPVEIEGKGLFLGFQTKVRFLPAEADTGILFVRTDLPGKPQIPATAENAFAKLRRTSVRTEQAEVETTEHLLSALHALEIDNIVVEINSSEVPNIDGCSLAFIDALRRAEIVKLEAQKDIFSVREPVSINDGESTIVAVPSENSFSIAYTLDYNERSIGAQHFSIEVTEENIVKEISPARTFCLQDEAEAFIKQGLGKGADYSNTLVIGRDGVIDNKLRFDNECVRHKILDLLGDLALLNVSLRANIVAIRSGHSTNIKFVKKVSRLLEEQGEETKKKETLLDVREINNILPHRYPMLLIDKVIELEGYKRAVGIKNVTINEPFFQGHFPGQPIMPGVLQIEAMAQLAGALLLRKAENVKKLAVLLSLDGVKLRKTVVPGDQMRIEAEAIKIKSRTGEVYTRATVDGQLVAEANMKFMIVDA